MSSIRPNIKKKYLFLKETAVYANIWRHQIFRHRFRQTLHKYRYRRNNETWTPGVDRIVDKPASIVRFHSRIFGDSSDVSESSPNVETHNVDPEKTGDKKVMHGEAYVKDAVKRCNGIFKNLRFKAINVILKSKFRIFVI